MTAGDVVLTIVASAVTTLVMTLARFPYAFRRMPKPMTAEEMTRAMQRTDWVAVATGGKHRTPPSGSAQCGRHAPHPPHQWGMQRNPVYMFCNGEKTEGD